MLKKALAALALIFAVTSSEPKTASAYSSCGTIFGLSCSGNPYWLDDACRRLPPCNFYIFYTCTGAGVDVNCWEAIS